MEEPRAPLGSWDRDRGRGQGKLLSCKVRKCRDSARNEKRKSYTSTLMLLEGSFFVKKSSPWQKVVSYPLKAVNVLWPGAMGWRGIMS